MFSEVIINVLQFIALLKNGKIRVVLNRIKVHLTMKSDRALNEGTLAEWESSVQLTLFRSAAFDNVNIIYFFVKQVTLLRRSTVLKLPGLKYYIKSHLQKLAMSEPISLKRKPSLQYFEMKIVSKYNLT